MICRKITYTGNFNRESVGTVFDITRKIEINGEVIQTATGVILNLEGDPSMIKLVQHQVERKLKTAITDKTVTTIPFKHFEGLNLSLC
jgi:hypothetical protein